MNFYKYQKMNEMNNQRRWLQAVVALRKETEILLGKNLGV